MEPKKRRKSRAEKTRPDAPAPAAPEPAPPAPADPPGAGLDPTTALFLDLAVAAAARAKPRALLLYGDVFVTRASMAEFMERMGGTGVVFVTREHENFAPCAEKGGSVLVVPDVRLTRMGQVKMAVLVGMSRNLLKLGDRVLCLTGVAGSAVLDTLFSLEVGREFELFSSEQGPDLKSFNADVFERVLTLATTLAQEGREGRPVGTTFVLGDMEELQPFVEQMIFNPFRGYPEKDRNILDPSMEETIREFSAIDGAFIIRRDGVVESAGSFLKSGLLGERLPRGLGARHQSAAAITASTNALAVTVSESTGTVTVFRGGKILIEMERPRALGLLRPRRPTEGTPGAARGDGDIA